MSVSKTARKFVSQVGQAVGLVDDVQARAINAQQALATAEATLELTLGRMDLGEGGVTEADVERDRAARDVARDRYERAAAAARVTAKRETEALAQGSADTLKRAWDEALAIAGERDAALARIVRNVRETETDLAEFCALSERLARVSPRPPDPPSVLHALKTQDRVLEIIRHLMPSAHPSRGVYPKGGVEALIEAEKRWSAWCSHRNLKGE